MIHSIHFKNKWQKKLRRVRLREYQLTHLLLHLSSYPCLHEPKCLIKYCFWHCSCSLKVFLQSYRKTMNNWATEKKTPLEIHFQKLHIIAEGQTKLIHWINKSIHAYYSSLVYGEVLFKITLLIIGVSSSLTQSSRVKFLNQIAQLQNELFKTKFCEDEQDEENEMKYRHLI